MKVHKKFANPETTKEPRPQVGCSVRAGFDEWKTECYTLKFITKEGESLSVSMNWHEKENLRNLLLDS